MAMTVEDLRRTLPACSWASTTVVDSFPEFQGLLAPLKLKVYDKNDYRKVVVVTLLLNDTSLYSGYGSSLEEALKELRNQRAFQSFIKAVETLGA